MGVRTWLLRRAMGRMRISDDIVRHLSTFQRLGENVEVQLPTEVMPVGARTVFRAVRTRAAAQLGPDWVWPFWLERQLDPRSAAFVPRGHLPTLANLTNRNWTMVGNVGSPWEAIVDGRGLVTPWFDGWSLDWWVGADDRWHFPSREVSVRQRLIEAAPVVETVMRVPGGDAVQRVYAVQDAEELAVVEFENASNLPFALALAVRPYNPEGLAVVERIELVDRTVTVDGRPALLLPAEPARVAGSTFHGGDSMRIVTEGRAGTTLPELRCEAGLAQAAFLFPLAHKGTLRVALPLVSERRTRRRRLARRRVERMPELPAALPSAASVARAWQAQTRRGLQLDLPDPSLNDAVEANRRYMLLFHDGPDITPGPSTYHRFWFRDAAYMLTAMDRFGLHAEVAEVLHSYPGRQHVDGYFFSQRQEWDSNGAAIWALAEHWRHTRDEELLHATIQSVSKGVRWIERKRHSKRRRGDATLVGLMPASVSAEHLGPFDYYYWDDFWSLRGLLDGSELLRAAGDDRAANEAREWAGGLRADLERSLELVAEGLGVRSIPAGPRRRPDPAMVGALVACAPLGLLPADDPAIVATLDAVREFCLGDAFYQSIAHTGLGTYLTLQLAFVELEQGDRRALDRLRWLQSAASPTYTWPEAIHPQLGGGCMGDGHHGWAAADFLSMVRNLLVRDVDTGLAMVSLLPEQWAGQPIDVRDAPTHYGQLSFAVRWHGDRPALLWELRPHPGVHGVTLTAPGLDPAWSTADPQGDALLSPVAGVSELRSFG
ncbi:MAG: hypothetical protein JO050_04720 [Acidimicrobiia bacterium]|nr:hypothetical protein [Acidimicrobiia bacterium]